MATLRRPGTIDDSGLGDGFNPTPDDPTGDSDEPSPARFPRGAVSLVMVPALVRAANTGLLRLRNQLTPGQRWTATLALSLAMVVLLYGWPARVVLVSPVPTTPVAGPREATEPATPSQTPVPDSGPGPSAARQDPSSPASTAPASTTGAVTTEAPTPPAPFGTVSVFAEVGDPGAPAGIAITSDGYVYVATGNGTNRGRPGPSVVMAHAPDGTLERIYTIVGQPGGHGEGLTGLVLDNESGLIVLDAATARVLRLDLASGEQTTLATLPDLPPCVIIALATCEPGVIDHTALPRAAAFDSAGHLFISDAGQATIWRIPPTRGAPEPWYQSRDFATGDGPAGLAVDARGDLVFTVGSTLDTANPGAGGLYKLAVTAAGQPGMRTLLASMAQGDEPTGVALGSSGRTYVALGGANALVVLTPDYTEARRVDNPHNGPIPLDGPVGLAFRGTSVLVTNQSPTANAPARWSVLDVAVEDTGATVYAAEPLSER